MTSCERSPTSVQPGGIAVVVVVAGGLEVDVVVDVEVDVVVEAVVVVD